MPLLQCFACNSVAPQPGPGILQCAQCASDFVEIVQERPEAATATASAATGPAETPASGSNAVPPQQQQAVPGLQGMLSNLLTSILPAALTNLPTDQARGNQTGDQGAAQGFSLNQLFDRARTQQREAAGQQQQQAQQRPQAAHPTPEAQAHQAAESYNATPNPPPFNEFFTHFFNFAAPNAEQAARDAAQQQQQAYHQAQQHQQPQQQQNSSFVRTTDAAGNSNITITWGSGSLFPTQDDPDSIYGVTSSFGMNLPPGANFQFSTQPVDLNGAHMAPDGHRLPEYLSNIPDIASYLAETLNASMQAGGMQLGDFTSFDNIISEMMNANPQSNVHPSSEAAIQNLKRETWPIQSKVANESEECSICQDEYQPQEVLVVLECKHAYHEECCLTWLKTNGVCPICRVPVKERPAQPTEATRAEAQGMPRAFDAAQEPHASQQPQPEEQRLPQAAAATATAAAGISFLPFHFQFGNMTGQQAQPTRTQSEDLPEDELD